MGNPPNPDGDVYLPTDETLRAIFNALDHDNSGVVSRKHVNNVLCQLLDLPPSKFSQVDLDAQVTFQGFCEIVRAAGKDLEQIDARYLSRRWAAMCEFENNYTVDFPTQTDTHIVHHQLSLPKARSGNHPDNQADTPSTPATLQTSSSASPLKTGKTDTTHQTLTLPSTTHHKESPKFLEIVKSLVAGGAAGATAKTVIAPLDRTKIIFQTSSKKYSFPNAAREIHKIYTNHGVHSLWKGHSATLSRVIPYAAIQFVSFDFFKRELMLPGDEHLTPVRRVLAGSLAGAVSVCCTYPLDLIRAQMAVSHEPVATGAMRRRLATIMDQEGVWGLYRGLSPTLLGILPYAGLAFGSFETLKQVVSHRNGTQDVTSLQRLFCGALAGLVAQSATYPLDIVRRRMQTDGVLRRVDPVEATIGAPGIAGGGRPGFPQSVVAGDASGRLYFSITQTFGHVLKHEGLKGGLYKGVTMNWVKGPVAAGISFTTFDYLKRVFEVEG